MAVPQEDAVALSYSIAIVYPFLKLNYKQNQWKVL